MYKDFSEYIKSVLDKYNENMLRETLKLCMDIYESEYYGISDFTIAFVGSPRSGKTTLYRILPAIFRNHIQEYYTSENLISWIKFNNTFYKPMEQDVTISGFNKWLYPDNFREIEFYGFEKGD